MAFKFSDEHISQFYSLGYTVFRGVIPSALIADLRIACERGRQLARKKNVNAQRFQPVAEYDIDQKPFEDFRDLPPLRDAIARVLSPRHTYGNTKTWLGVLVEPGERPYCTNWHRDWIHHQISNKEATLSAADFRNVDFFNQLNGALYEDSSTWVVPGSHNRADLPGEIAAFQPPPVPPPHFEGTTVEEAEQIALEYCRRMPGAVQLHLNAGDLALYRNLMWHIGNYAPYRKRATLHDIVDTPEYDAWRKKMGGPR